MDKIKAAEAAIKALKAYIEIEKASKEILIIDPEEILIIDPEETLDEIRELREETLDEIRELREVIIHACCENLEIIKKGE